MQAPRVRLGELLVRAGLLSEGQLAEALAEQARVGQRLGSLLVELGLVSETQVTQILSQQLSVPWVSLHHIDFSTELLSRVPMDVVERFCLIPIYVRRVRGLGEALYVAMDDPTNDRALKEVADCSGLNVRAMIAPPSDIKAAIHTYYGIGEKPRPGRRAPASQERDDDEDDAQTGVHSRSGIPSAPDAAPAPPAAPGPAEAARKSVPVAAPPSVRPPLPEAPAVPAAPEGAVPRRMVALTLLDGTTIQVPARARTTKRAGARVEAEEAPSADHPAAADAEVDGEGGGDALTARDIVAALRAQARGADASEILGENIHWEAMFAALLTLLLKKKLIRDLEFVEEFKKL